jgi:hypothetical protein
MGLNERRAIQAFQNDLYPALKKALDQVVGYELPIEVKWETLAADSYSHLYNEAFPKLYFEPLQKALQTVCSDQMGKDALKAGLKKIVISNTKHNPYGSGFTFENGVLDINHDLCNVDDVAERASAIQKLLENGL